MSAVVEAYEVRVRFGNLPYLVVHGGRWERTCDLIEVARCVALTMAERNGYVVDRDPEQVTVWVEEIDGDPLFVVMVCQIPVVDRERREGTDGYTG